MSQNNDLLDLGVCIKKIKERFENRTFKPAVIKFNCNTCSDTGFIQKQANTVAPCPVCRGKDQAKPKPKVNLQVSDNAIF